MANDEPPVEVLESKSGESKSGEAKGSAPRRHRRRGLSRRGWLTAVIVLVMVIGGTAAAAGAFYNSVATPQLTPLAQNSTLYYADGTTPLAYVGDAHRRVLDYAELGDPVGQAAVAAADPGFWSDHASPISRTVVRALDSNRVGSGLTTRARVLVAASKLEAAYDKQTILAYYLNLEAFGRDALGVQTAAQVYFGKPAKQLTVAEAITLIGMIGQPDPDPTASPAALADSRARFDTVRQAMVSAGYLSSTAAAALAYPTVQPRQSTVDTLLQPTGLAAQHALAELRQLPLFKGHTDFSTAGFDIVTTIDKRAQTAVEGAANSQLTSSVLHGQPAGTAAAAVLVEPGTGRVLAYYGGASGGGADYAGWYYDADGHAVGYGAHPPGATFDVYDLATALKEGISVDSRWSSPAGSKEFPEAGRVAGQLGPVVESGQAPCQPRCTLADAANHDLVVPYFDLTLHIAPTNVLVTARDAGIDSMWASINGSLVRQDLAGVTIGTAQVPGTFNNELGIGQYPVTVLDQANAMATFAAQGRRAGAHFVRAVQQDGHPVYSENTATPSIGLTPGQIGDLDAALSDNPLGQLPGIASASQGGTAQFSATDPRPGHAWVIGYTSSLALAVWVGDERGGPIATTGSATPQGLPAAIYRAAMISADQAMHLKPAPFPAPGDTGQLHPAGSI
jgi:membrane peptidoglycan carboxypeptidase